MKVKIFGQEYDFVPNMRSLRRIEDALAKHGISGGLTGLIPQEKGAKMVNLSTSGWVDLVCAAVDITPNEDASVSFIEVSDASGKIISAYFSGKKS